MLVKMNQMRRNCEPLFLNQKQQVHEEIIYDEKTKSNKSQNENLYVQKLIYKS